MNNLVLDLAIAGGVIWMIASQFKGTAIGVRRLVVLPAVVVVIGASNLGGLRNAHPADMALLVTSGGIAVAIGLCQGAVVRLEERNGALWGRTPLWAVSLWVALIASRVALHVFAGAHHDTLTASFAAIVLTLGVNRLAQAAVIAGRALMAGIPFAPSGASGRLLSR
jgi:hypothetical protein